METSVFSCRRCGECCRGAGGIILTDLDLERLAAHLGVDAEAFAATYAEEHGGRVRLRSREDGYCVFYDLAIKGCGVHLARPDVCRAWPFFRGNLVDESSWFMSSEECKGINRDAGHEEFVRQGWISLREQGILERAVKGGPSAIPFEPEGQSGPDGNPGESA